MGVGQSPVGADWNTVASGSSSSPVTNFGTIDMNDVRAAIAASPPPADPGGPTFSSTSTNPLKNEFTVRLVVEGDGIATPGIDRRVLASAADPDLRPGFPKRMGTGGEAPLRYADINGDNTQELILPTEDGTVHAYRPNGSELPGWPVRTGMMLQSQGHSGAPGFAALSATPPREPPRGPLVVDLDDDGRPEVITTAGTHLYAWEPDGSVRPGFPVSSDLGLCGPSLQSQPDSHPKCGFLASPVAARLDGPDEPFSIVATALDGHLYAFDGDGASVSGYPVRLADPDEADPLRAESINEPAVDDLNGDGRDDIVVATNETYDAQAPSLDPDTLGLGVLGDALTDLLANAAGGSSRVYAVNGADGQFLSGWPIKLNGAIQDTLPLIGPGHNPAIATIGGEKRIVATTTGSTTIGVYGTDGSEVTTIDQAAPGGGSDATVPVGSLNLFESASIGRLSDNAGGPSVVKYGLGLSAALNLLLAGQNLPYNHLIGAYDPQTGLAEANFLASPTTTSSSPRRTSPSSIATRPATRCSRARGWACCTPTMAPPAPTSRASRR